MADINTYANDLLIEFLDACHDEVRAALYAEFGDSWFIEGIERHLHPTAFKRTHAMLTSPMAIIDMHKTVDELYGVEHLASIILGNWSLFKCSFVDRNRTQVYFGEIAELRHNVSHRRQHHMLSKREILRFVANASLLLAAFGSPLVSKFESIATSLEQGGTPWGSQLIGTLPPANEIVSDFVGRESELRRLSIWLTTADAHQLLVWGYGGSGKSALAYQFARTVRDGAPRPLQAVLWLSAKRREFMAGETRDRLADFDSLESFTSAFWNALYGMEPSANEATLDYMVQELDDTPLLLIIDDLDSVLDDLALARLLLFEIRKSNSMIIYTSRQRIPGLDTIEVLGFSDDELTSFVRSCARKYKLDTDECLNRLTAISRVTNGFPLFVDDLLRHAMFGGLSNSIRDWTQRKGDKAREYSLRRQLESLGEAGQHVLMAAAVANRPVSSYELSNIAGFTDDDVQHAISDLLNWRLLNQFEHNTIGHPTFLCNINTKRLVEKTYGRDPTYTTYKDSFRSLAGPTRSGALRRAVGQAINEAKVAMSRGDYEGAEERIHSAITGELENDPDLWGVLGWAISRQTDDDAVARARKAFRRSHNLGSRKEDLYYHWIDLERELAERLVNTADDEKLLAQWRQAAKVAKRGIDRCGDTSTLCSALAYLRTREAKTLERLRNFKSAEYRYKEGVEWALRALDAPNPSSREVNRSRLYRSLVIALDGCEDHEGVVQALMEWKSVVGQDDADWQREYDRLARISGYQKHLGCSQSASLQ